MNIGDNIRRLRWEKGWSQKELADQLFVTKQTVSRWEHGLRSPDVETLVKIADLFDAELKDLL